MDENEIVIDCQCYVLKDGECEDWEKLAFMFEFLRASAAKVYFFDLFKGCDSNENVC